MKKIKKGFKMTEQSFEKWLFRGALVVLGLNIVFIALFAFLHLYCSTRPTPIPNSAPSTVSVPAVDSYERGRRLGHIAAMRQFAGVTDIADDPLAVAYQYVGLSGVFSDLDDIEDPDSEERADLEARGYVDGYHRALESLVCPPARSSY
jgi:hypothetical protein